MSDFTRPEYASYVALCRELNLSHPLSERTKYGTFQVPSLSDWFEMLGTTGVSLTFVRVPPTFGWWAESTRWTSGVVSPTREEAMARLWMRARAEL